jgi:hypothetical protein
VKRPAFILILGLAGCLLAFTAVYFLGTAGARGMMQEAQPELAWLKKEFKLRDAEYQRILALHQEYLPKCAERCRYIEEQNEELRRLLTEAHDVTPEIVAVMNKRAQMRAECEAEMLKHFFAVSRTMPPEQGRRYLAWIEEQTFLRGSAMEQQHKTETESHSHHHH